MHQTADKNYILLINYAFFKKILVKDLRLNKFSQEYFTFTFIEKMSNIKTFKFQD